MAQRKAPSHTALSLAAQSHPVGDDNCIFVDAEEAWIQYSVARRALIFHLKEYLRSVDTDVATQLDTSDTSIDIRGSWNLVPASDASYWQTKVARDSVIKDCNDVLFWMEMIKLQESTGGKMWNTVAAAGAASFIFLQSPLALAPAAVILTAKAVSLVTISASAAAGLKRWQHAERWSRCFRNVELCLEAASSWKISHEHLEKICGVDYKHLDRPARPRVRRQGTSRQQCDVDER